MNVQKKRFREIDFKGAGFLWLCLFVLTGLLAFEGFFVKTVNASEDPSQTVKIGYYQAENFQEGDGDTSLRKGYAYEYIQKVSSYTGWKYQYVPGTWEELYEKLLNGEIDLLAGVSYETDRKDKVLYPQYEMLKETFYIYVDSRDTSITGGDISSYSGKKIGITDDLKMKAALDEWMGKTQADIEVVSYKNLEECSKDFNQGKIDGFVSADNIVSSYSGIAPIEMIGKCPYYLCVSKGRQDLLVELNEALSIINSQDSLYLDSLRSKYMADSSIGKFLSKQEKEWLDAHKKISVGYLNHYLPYSDTGKSGEVTGVIKDILEELFNVLPGDYKPEIVYQSFDNQEKMIEALKNNEIDMVFPVGEETNYAEKNGFQQSTAIMNSAIDLVYTGKYSEEKNSRIAVNENNQLQYYYTIEHFPEADIILCDSTEECIRKVKKGEASSTVMDALRSVKLVGEDKKLTLLPMAEGNRICFGVNFGNSDLLWVLNQGISMLGEEYGINYSYKYMGDIVVYTTDDFLRSHKELIYGAAVLFGLLIVAIFVTRYMSMKKQTRLETEHSEKLQQALEKEQEALKKAHQAGRAKQIFLNNMSHDMRTPLNGIMGILEMNRKCQDPQILEENRKKAGAAVQQAVKKFTDAPERTYDVILMDLMMPVMNGYDAARGIRLSGKSDAETVPIIAMTACVSQEARDLSTEAGMNGFIEKPQDMDRMLEVISGFRGGEH